jgi:hypothetical protein
LETIETSVKCGTITWSSRIIRSFSDSGFLFIRANLSRPVPRSLLPQITAQVVAVLWREQKSLPPRLADPSAPLLIGDGRRRRAGVVAIDHLDRRSVRRVFSRVTHYRVN